MRKRRSGIRRHDAKGRDKAERRFIKLPYDLLEHDSVLNLSGTEFKALVYMAKRYDGRNNGKIGFGVRSGCFRPCPTTGRLIEVSIRIGPSAMSAAIRKLRQVRLVKVTQDASFDQKRLQREFELTWIETKGQAPTRDYQRGEQQFVKLDLVRSGALEEKLPVRDGALEEKTPVRRKALSPDLQCANANQSVNLGLVGGLNSSGCRTIDRVYSASARSHLVTIPSDKDGRNGCDKDAIGVARSPTSERASAASLEQTPIESPETSALTQERSAQAIRLERDQGEKTS